MGYQGGYTQVKVAVCEIKRIRREVFMPLIHRPGEAQVDFGYALVGKERYQKIKTSHPAQGICPYGSSLPKRPG